MSGTGSPADQQGQADNNANADAPAGANADSAVIAPVSGDANLSADASSAPAPEGAKEAPPKPTLADVIKTAASLDEQGKSPAPANDGTKPEGEVDPAKADATDPKDDTKLPFHNHPRWKEVIGQNKTLTEEVATLRPDAEQYGKIQSFMQEHHLSHDEVGELFVVGAMAKAGDPRALQKIDEYRNRLALAIGETLPPEIQEQVDSGAITEAAGKEMAKLRAQNARATADASRLSEVDTARRSEEQAENQRRDFQAAVTAWSAEIQKSDPDFAKKEKAIARYARAIMQEQGAPKNRDEAVKIVKDAYAEVNKDFASALPAKQPVRNVPSAPSSHGAKQKPNSLLDAVRAAAAE